MARPSLRISLKDGTPADDGSSGCVEPMAGLGPDQGRDKRKNVAQTRPQDAPSVGDRCVFLEEGPCRGQNSPIGSITGKNAFAKAGRAIARRLRSYSRFLWRPAFGRVWKLCGDLGGEVLFPAEIRLKPWGC